MRQTLRAAVFVLAASWLAACGGYYVPSTPRYPARAGVPATPPPPHYPVAPETTDGGVTGGQAVLPPAPSAGVEAEALPPLREDASEIASETLPPPPPSQPVEPARPTPPARAEAESPPLRPGDAYVVQAGDTLSGIGRRFATPVRTLMTLNGIGEDGAIGVGSRVILPDGARDLGPDPYATGPAPTRTGAQVRETPPAPPPPPPANSPVAPPPAASGTGTVTADGFPTSADLIRRAGGRFAWPIRGELLTRFGTMGSGLRSDGINIAAGAGDEVRASAAGQVAYAGDSLPGLGTTVVIVHGDGWVTAYSHLRSTNVRMEQRVTAGQVIGAAGMSGGVSQPQVHFEIRYAPGAADRPRPIDPIPLLPR